MTQRIEELVTMTKAAILENYFKGSRIFRHHSKAQLVAIQITLEFSKYCKDVEADEHE